MPPSCWLAPARALTSRDARPCVNMRNIRTIKTSTTHAIFGKAGSAEFLAAASTPESIPKLHGLPEVIVTGRANVGKSSLFNAVLGRKDLLHTSKKAGRTQTLNYYRVGTPPGKVVLVDAPGYGARGRSEWGELFDHYVDTRQELKRIYILFSAKHGLNEIDKLMLASLSDRITAHGGTKHTLQAVITKLDTLPLPGAQQHIAKLKKEIFEAAPVCLPPLFTSVAKHPFLGVEELRVNIMDACGLGA